MISKINPKTVTHCRQRPVGGIEQRVRSKIITRLQPFAFEQTPKYLGDVEMRRIRRKKEDMHPALLPQWPKLKQFSGSMDRGVVEHNHGFSLNCKREVIQITDYRICINAVFCCKPGCATSAVNHGEAIHTFTTLRWDINIFLGKFPSVWNIGFFKKMGFISVVKVNSAVIPQLFKLLQLPKLILVELRQVFPLWTYKETSEGNPLAAGVRL